MTLVCDGEDNQRNGRANPGNGVLAADSGAERDMEDRGVKGFAHCAQQAGNRVCARTEGRVGGVLEADRDRFSAENGLPFGFGAAFARASPRATEQHRKGSMEVKVHVALFCFLLAQTAHAQVIEPAGGARGGERIESRDSLDYANGHFIDIASQSIGGINVVRDVHSGANALNPAVLGAWKDGMESGTAGFVHTSVMPLLNLPDMKASTYFISHRVKGTGWSLRKSNFMLPAGPLDGIASANEEPFSGDGYSLSMGRRAFAASPLEHHFGLTLKFINAPEMLKTGSAGSNGYLFDAGYFGTFRERFRLGFSLVNIGHALSGIRPVVTKESTARSTRVHLEYRTDERHVLTPFSIHTGLGLDHQLGTERLHILQTTLSAALSAEFSEKGSGITNWHLSEGVDLKILNTFAPAIGMSYFGGEPVVRMILGLHLFNHFAVSLSILASDGPFFDAQKTASLEIRNLLRWGKGDWVWWRK
jgi:hypothetical protein